MPSNVLILTDRDYHRPRDSMFHMARHLAKNPLIGNVWVADRADAENAGFYKDLDPSFNAWHVRPVNDQFNMDTNTDDALRPACLIKETDFDAVWIRLEHPVESDFLKYLQARLPDTFTVNNAAGLDETMSKEYLMTIADVLGELTPKSALCKTAAEVAALEAQCPQGVVLKQIFSNGGKGVARYRPGKDTDLKDVAEVEAYIAENGPCLTMEYLNPPTPQSDNRVLVMNGVILGVVSRIPQAGSWICNLSSGGSAQNIAPTAEEIETINRIDPLMRKAGIFLYGADMLLNDKGLRVLSEINTLNVGAVAVSEELTGKPITKFVADNLAAVIDARDFHIPTVDLDKIVA